MIFYTVKTRGSEGGVLTVLMQRNNKIILLIVDGTHLFTIVYAQTMSE